MSDDSPATPLPRYELPADERWKVTDLGGASWALGHLARARHGLARIAEERRDQKARIDAWAKEAGRTEAGTESRMTERLHDYAWSQLMDQCPDGADITDEEVWAKISKKLSLPTGYVQAVRTVGAYEISDQVAWNDYAIPSGIAAQLEQIQAGGIDVRAFVPPPNATDDRFWVTPAGQVVEAGTGEAVPGLVWQQPQIRLNKPTVTDLGEHPAWTAPPAGSEHLAELLTDGIE